MVIINDRLSSFQVIRISFFCRLGLKISVFLRGLTPKFKGIVQIPKRHILARFEPSLVQIWPTVRRLGKVQCGLVKKIKTRKKDNCKLTIRPDHPHRRIEVKVCVTGGLQCVVLYIKFRFSGFAGVGGRKLLFPITLAIGLYNSLYYRTSRDTLLWLITSC